MMGSDSSFNTKLAAVVMVAFGMLIWGVLISQGDTHVIAPASTTAPVSVTTPTAIPLPVSTPTPTPVATPMPTPTPTPAYSHYTPTYNSGYDAGYAWGEQYNICDTSYSNGKSDDFNEGVQAWANDNCLGSSDDSSSDPNSM